MGAPRIEAHEVSQVYRSRRAGRGLRRRAHLHWAVKGVSFSVEPGEMFGVIGGNGSGKTTLLQTVAGVLPPAEGRIVTRGRVSSLVDLSAGFHRDLTGYENLRVGGVLMGMSKAELDEKWDDIIEFSGLDDDALASPLRTYSSGMGVRLGFSVTIHTEPDVLLVDEVLAVGDAAFKSQCFERVFSLRERGCAVMIVTHDLGLVREQADRVLVLHKGEPQFLGEADEAVDRYLEITKPRHRRQDFSHRALYEGRSQRNPLPEDVA